MYGIEQKKFFSKIEYDYPGIKMTLSLNVLTVSCHCGVGGQGCY